MPGAPTQAEFAAIAGVARSTIVRYEKDEPGADKPIMIKRWADVTGYNEVWLETGELPSPGGDDGPGLEVRHSASNDDTPATVIPLKRAA